MWPHGRARVNANAPEAWGCCDRCGFLYNLSDLQWQYEWYGNELKKTGYRCCRICTLPPNPQQRILHLPPDPEPVKDPRPIEPIYALNLEAVQDEIGSPLTDEEGNQIFQDQSENVG